MRCIKDIDPSLHTTCTYTAMLLRGKRERLITFSSSFWTTYSMFIKSLST